MKLHWKGHVVQALFMRLGAMFGYLFSDTLRVGSLYGARRRPLGVCLSAFALRRPSLGLRLSAAVSASEQLPLSGGLLARLDLSVMASQWQAHGLRLSVPVLWRPPLSVCPFAAATQWQPLGVGLSVFAPRRMPLGNVHSAAACQRPSIRPTLRLLAMPPSVGLSAAFSRRRPLGCGLRASIYQRQPSLGICPSGYAPQRMPLLFGSGHLAVAPQRMSLDSGLCGLSASASPQRPPVIDLSDLGS
jgi:hypothetical protein